MQTFFFSMHALVQAFDVDAARISGDDGSRLEVLAEVEFSGSDMPVPETAATATPDRIIADIKKMLRNMMITPNKLLKDGQSLTHICSVCHALARIW